MSALEYLLIYTQGGLPIYSKCYGNFCELVFQKPELLSGFLSALETLPSTLSDTLSLDVVIMGHIELRFSKTTPSGHTIVVGLDRDSSEVADVVFNAVNKILQLDKFKGIDWRYVTGEVIHDFERHLVTQVLPDILHKYDGIGDDCPKGEQCLFHIPSEVSQELTIWSLLKTRYKSLKAKMMKM